MNHLVPADQTSTREIGIATGPAGASIAPQNLGEVVRFAEVMSRADIALPKHLRGNAGACMAVAMQALQWEMNPFAVASKSYSVNGIIAYEAQLIAAVVNTRSGIKGRLRYEFIGEGNDLSCKVHEGFEPDLVRDCAPAIIVFCAKAQMKRMIEFAEANGFRWNLTTFNKTNPTPLCGANYLPDTEYIFHFWKGVRLGGGYADKSRFWVGPASGDSKVHPTIKPVGLMEKLIRVSVDHPSPVIMDPFMGSGTTGVACVKLGRSFIGIEIDEGYFDIACDRIRKAYAQPDMFVAQREPELVQRTLFGGEVE